MTINLNHHLSMHCLNVDAQINMKFYITLGTVGLLSSYVTESTTTQGKFYAANNSKVNLRNHIHGVHDKMRIWHFLSYLSQILMDLVQILLLLEPFTLAYENTVFGVQKTGFRRPNIRRIPRFFVP